MADYRADLLKILKQHGCYFIRHGKGSHDIWCSPINGRRFSIQKKIRSRITANNLLKQAGLDKAF